MRKVKPLGSKILVRQVDTTGSNRSNIIIPNTAKAALKEAMVVDTGPGYRITRHMPEQEHFSPLQVKKGDRIVYDPTIQMHHIDLPDGDGRYIIMDENAIIAKLEEIPNG